MRVISRRLGFYIITAIAAVSVDFLIPRMIPGNPVDAVLAHMQGQVVTKATLRALELQFGVEHQGGHVGPVPALLGQPGARQPRHLDQQRPRPGHHA